MKTPGAQPIQLEEEEEPIPVGPRDEVCGARQVCSWSLEPGLFTALCCGYSMISDVMTASEREDGERWLRLLSSIFTGWRVQAARQSKNSSRGKQGRLFQKTPQGVSAKSHTMVSAPSV